MSSGISTTLDHLERNPSFYLPGGDGYFLVDRQLFRVHRYFLERESSVFREWFQSPAGSGEIPNGGNESAAIVLQDVTPAAFEKLLNVFYNQKYSVYGWPVEDWTTIIGLAQKWKLPEVLELAIRELQKADISLIKRIALYQRLKLHQSHLIPLYRKLCNRPQALNLEESSAISLQTAVLIFNARERLLTKASNGGTSPFATGFKDSDVDAALMAFLPLARLLG